MLVVDVCGVGALALHRVVGWWVWMFVLLGWVCGDSVVVSGLSVVLVAGSGGLSLVLWFGWGWWGWLISWPDRIWVGLA